MSRKANECKRLLASLNKMQVVGRVRKTSIASIVSLSRSHFHLTNKEDTAYSTPPTQGNRREGNSQNIKILSLRPLISQERTIPIYSYRFLGN